MSNELLVSLEKELEDLLERKEQVTQSYQRLEGRREAAKNQLDALKKECLDMGVEPIKLDETIAALETKLKSGIESLKEKIKLAEEDLKPFKGSLNDSQ